MKSKQEMMVALDTCNQIGEILEDSFERVQMTPTTPNVFHFKCKRIKCKEGVGKAERMEHLRNKHGLPYFVTGKEALEWILQD